MSYDLVIFDCDGTLVDSEYLHNRVISEMLVDKYPRYTVDYTLKAFVGMGMTTVVRTIEDDVGEKLPSDFISRYTGLVTSSVEKWMKPIDGVHDVVRGLHGQRAICVGSNGERENVLALLRASKLHAYFPESAVFTADMVAAPKPAPDLFLLAAKACGAEPSRTLVVEDSIPGVLAAKAAGMTVAGFTGTFHDREIHTAALRAAGADYVTDRFIQIPAWAGL